MAGVALQIRQEDAEFKALLREIIARAKDLTPAMKIAGEIMRTSIVRNFEEGGRPKKWRRLSEATKFQIIGGIRGFKKRGGGLKARAHKKIANKKILIESGRLAKSNKPKAHRDRVEIGTNVEYAAIHQFGGKAGRGHKAIIPARPFLMVQDEDVGEIKHAIIDHLMEGVS